MCGGYWSYNVNFISLLILGFGFQQICVYEFGDRISLNSSFDILKMNLYAEVILYAVLPLAMIWANIGQDSLSIYCLISGMLLIIGVIFIWYSLMIFSSFSNPYSQVYNE